MSAATGTFRHEALIYRDSQEYLAGTLPFVRGGLIAGEPVLVAVPGDNLVLLRDALDGNADRVSLLDMTEAGRNPGRIIPAVLHAFVYEHAPSRVRIIGEPIWPGRSDTEYPACVQHEALINDAFDGRPATILCPYDARGLAPEMLADATRTHPIMVDGDDRRSSDGYTDPGLVVAAFNQPLPEPAEPTGTMTFLADDLPGVRHLVGKYAAAAGLDSDRIGDLQLAVNEVATNSVVHAGGPGTLRVWREHAHLVCEIRDSGRLTNRLAGRIPPAPNSEQGRGLLLVNYLCDLVRVHTSPSQTTIRLFMRL
jgi:anti-sigma regulatory factor (Ser/Thr protein kinase)